MTAVANKLLEDFKKLAPDEQWIVRERVISLTEVLQRQALNRLRGSSAARGCWTNCSPTGPGSVPVADAVILDTSAILTLTGNEPGADEVQTYLAE